MDSDLSQSWSVKFFNGDTSSPRNCGVVGIGRSQKVEFTMRADEPVQADVAAPAAVDAAAAAKPEDEAPPDATAEGAGPAVPREMGHRPAPRGFFTLLDLVVVAAALLFLAWVWVFIYKQPIPTRLLHWFGCDDPVFPPGDEQKPE
jgi:hypothetical protein